MFMSLILKKYYDHYNQLIVFIASYELYYEGDIEFSKNRPHNDGRAFATSISAGSMAPIILRIINILTVYIIIKMIHKFRRSV